MKPGVVLGFEPAPGDAAVLESLTAALHRVLRGLVMGRSGLDAIGHTGSAWDGPSGAPVVTVLRRYSVGLGELEELVLACLQAMDEWSRGTAERQEDAQRVADGVADLAGRQRVDDHRERLLARAREIETAHRAAAKPLVAAFEDLAAGAATVVATLVSVADDLDAALLARSAAVDEWIEQEAPALLRSAATLSEVAGLTTVISDLVGVAALHRTPEDAAGARAVVAGSPAAYRLVKALHSRWAEVAPEALPAASFAAARRTGLADALAPRDSRPRDSGPPASAEVVDAAETGGPPDAR